MKKIIGYILTGLIIALVVAYILRKRGFFMKDTGKVFNDGMGNYGLAVLVENEASIKYIPGKATEQEIKKYYLDTLKQGNKNPNTYSDKEYAYLATGDWLRSKGALYEVLNTGAL